MNETIALQYAKKIYGFAYSKTKDTHQAEDLSQEILIKLLECDLSEVDNMDAYIYRICCYTWANFLRKNKKEWNMLGFDGDMNTVPSEENPEDAVIKKELYEQVRLEIMYLSKTRREIMIKYYYENLSGKEISSLLGINHATVRWHMKEIKSDLKERMEMNENIIYTPKSLNVGHSGWVTEYSMSGLGDDLVVQNICIVCREKPLTVEEISRTMGIAAAYIENKIASLVYMDYLKQVGNKYQTTFYIEDGDVYAENLKFFHNIVFDMAKSVNEYTEKAVKLFRESGALAGEFSDDFLKYALAMPVIEIAMWELSVQVDKMASYPHEVPKRKDGSEHFVVASFSEMPKLNSKLSEFPSEVLDFWNKSGSYGWKTRGNGEYASKQCDLSIFSKWREFNDEELSKLARVYEIVKNGEKLKDYDLEVITYLCNLGYVEVRDCTPVICVPIVTDAQKYQDILNALRADFAENVNLTPIAIKFAEHNKELDKLIPKYLDKNERNFAISNFSGFGYPQIVSALKHCGYLSEPTEAEKKRICTLVYKVTE